MLSSCQRLLRSANVKLTLTALIQFLQEMQKQMQLRTQLPKREQHTHTHTHMLTDTDIPSSLTAMQQFSTTEERQIWKKKGCTLQNVWYGSNDKPAQQNISLPTLLS